MTRVATGTYSLHCNVTIVVSYVTLHFVVRIVSFYMNQDIPSETNLAKDVVFETINSVCLGVGMCLIAAIAADCVYNSWTARALKPPIPQNVCNLFTGKLTVACVGLSAALGIANAVKHNKTMMPHRDR